MKQIKKIVLKEATKLTNSEMKKIRGGVEQGYSQTCSATCYSQTGAFITDIAVDCDTEYICESNSEYGAGYAKCFKPGDGYYEEIKGYQECPKVDY